MVDFSPLRCILIKMPHFNDKCPNNLAQEVHNYKVGHLQYFVSLKVKMANLGCKCAGCVIR